MAKRKTSMVPPFKMTKMSELPKKKQEKTPVIIMDKKMPRKIKVGEHLKLATVAKKEGVLDFMEAPEKVPGGETPIIGPTVSGGTLSNAIMRDFGSFCTGGAVFLSDGFYFLYPDNDIKKVLSEDLTDLQMWINTYFDCDDFAQVVAGVMNDRLKGIPFGILWFKGPGFYHAVNCYYSQNQRKMKVVEPQNDAIYDFNKASWCPMLVVI